MRRAILAAAAVFIAIPIHAQQPAPPSTADEAAIVEQLRTSVRFEDDGTGRREIYLRVKIQSEAGVQHWGQLALGFNAATERMDIPLVRVRKPDGTTVDTPSSGIQELSSPVERIAPMYTDFRQKHVTVQSLRPGDTLEARVVTTVHTPLAPGQFWAEFGFNDDDVVLSEELNVDVPAKKAILLKTAPGLQAETQEAAGRLTYHWVHSHLVREDEKAQAEKARLRPWDEPEREPIRLTTFRDWNEVGSWFGALERTARQPTTEIREKARELTAGRTTDLAKLEALYDYVSKNFRYVSLSLGSGRYQPRAAADVLHDAYGDCKDKHTLLASLIEAAGLTAAPVLSTRRSRSIRSFPRRASSTMSSREPR